MSTGRFIYQVPETRDHILDEAYRLLREQGFHQVKMTDIADAAGVSRTSLYRYYQDKFDLSLALIGRLLEEHWYDEEVFGERLAAAPNGHAQLEILLRQFFWTEEGETLERFFAQFDAYFSDFTAPEDFTERMAAVMPIESFGLIDEIVRRGIDDGSIRSDLPEGAVRVAAMNAIRGLAHRLVLRGGMLLEREAMTNDEAMDSIIRIVLDGLRPQAP